MFKLPSNFYLFVIFHLIQRESLDYTTFLSNNIFWKDIPRFVNGFFTTSSQWLLPRFVNKPCLVNSFSGSCTWNLTLSPSTFQFISSAFFWGITPEELQPFTMLCFRYCHQYLFYITLNLHQVKPTGSTHPCHIANECYSFLNSLHCFQEIINIKTAKLLFTICCCTSQFVVTAG